MVTKNNKVSGEKKKEKKQRKRKNDQEIKQEFPHLQHLISASHLRFPASRHPVQYVDLGPHTCMHARRMLGGPALPLGFFLLDKRFSFHYYFENICILWLHLWSIIFISFMFM